MMVMIVVETSVICSETHRKICNDKEKKKKKSKLRSLQHFVFLMASSFGGEGEGGKVLP